MSMKASRLAIRAALVSAVSVNGLIGGLVGVAHAQTAEVSTGVEDIIVTAQRQAQSLQDVPIAVSAFTAESLAAQQINNAQQLQLTLPNITFSKGNFTGSSFTIRGVGDLCVGVSCDSATAIHLNDLPLFATRLFETEYFDLERVEVLRGPQGTLFGRNATSGVVNFVTGKPDASGFKASGEALYGNYNEIRLQGMVNIPLGENFAARVAGFYLKRDGYTENLFNGEDHDGRDMFALRGSLRWEPTDATTIDLMGYWFKEDDNRMRIQKQVCQRDPTGVLGCLPGRQEYGITNANSTFVGTLSSREFLRSQGGAGIGALGLGSLYGPDAYANNVNPADPRKVNTDFTPTYLAEEIQVQAKIEHDFGGVKAKLSGQFQENSVDSSQDYNLSVQNASLYAPGLNTLAAYAGGLGGPALQAAFSPLFNAALPRGANGGVYCASLAEETGTGIFQGNSLCDGTPQDFDRSNQYLKAWTIEGIVSTDFDGKFNFLAGAIYNKVDMKENSYYVNSFGIDYVAGVLGGATFLGAGGRIPPVYLGTPFFRNNTDQFTLNSYGIFGEAYFDASDSLRFTVGLRYNNDSKYVRARSTLASFAVPVTQGNAFDSPLGAGFDADPGSPTRCPTTSPTGSNATVVPGAIGSVAGCEAFQERNADFDEFTGRFVVDYRITDDNLLYASYSRGYKSGGINPPLQPIFQVPETFAPESIDAFEIGSKNRFMDGVFQLNATAFYYKYKGLQLSRIVARTSVNDNVDANIWGVEIEGIVNPIPPLVVNFGFSYLNTEVASDKFLSNPRDPSGGRSDAVIVKDITNGSNCTVVPRAGNPTGQAGSSAFVTAANNAINAGAIPGLQAGAGLRGPTAFPSDSGLNGATGAFGICGVLGALGTAASGFEMLPAGVEVNLKGNSLPQAPEFKFSTGVQYTIDLASGISIVPRWDLAFTGESYGNVFNGNVNRVPAYEVMNAQIQVNGVDSRWYVRAFIQNITNNNATTGLYVTDQSSGLFTNIFTLEPRRYGLAAGFNF
jgi:outer membrane receptor protein involved in Fe transport